MRVEPLPTTPRQRTDWVTSLAIVIIAVASAAIIAVGGAYIYNVLGVTCLK